MTNIISIQDTNSLQIALQYLGDGGIVIFPSDTVYGLLVDATNPRAVEKLIAFKNRPPGKAISVFVQDMHMFERTVEVNTETRSILERLLPGPFTIVLPSHHTVCPQLESERGTLGVRLPEYGPVRELVRAFGKPITATSANLGGKSPHYSIPSLMHQLPDSKKQLIDCVVDAGQLPRNKPSTVMDLSGETIRYLRRGDILPRSAQEFISGSPSETRKNAAYLLSQVIAKSEGKAIVFLLEGELGAGKTVFAKGIGEALGIEKIVSPTFVVYYEYEIKNEELRKKHYTQFVHADFYNIQEESEFTHLGFENMLDKDTIMVIEWSEKTGSLEKLLQSKACCVRVRIIQESPDTRIIHAVIPSSNHHSY